MTVNDQKADVFRSPNTFLYKTCKVYREDKFFKISSPLKVWFHVSVYMWCVFSCRQRTTDRSSAQ